MEHARSNAISAPSTIKRFAEATAIIATEATEHGRADHRWQHGYQPWVGVGDTKEEARRRVAAEMEAFYRVPFEAFEKYTPHGTPADIAETLQAYVDAGCSMFNLKVVAGSDAASIEAAGEIVEALR